MKPANPNQKVILTGGGTGGHVFPLLAVGRKLTQKNSALKLIYFGSGAKIEKEQAKANHISYQRIYCGKWRRNFSLVNFFLNIGDLVSLKIGFFQALYWLRKIRPAIIFSKGGYVSLPTVLAGAVLKIPIIAHESDLMTGLANRIALRYANRIAVAFPLEAYPMPLRLKAYYAGLPLREQFDHKITSEAKHILVVGGSSGAVSLNSQIFAILEKLLAHHRVVHLTGELDYPRAKAMQQRLSENLRSKYSVLPFSQEMPRLLAESKLVISRAGATAIFEAAAFNKKAIFVPIFEQVTPHQIMNALYLKQRGLAEIHFSSDKPDKLFQKIRESLANEKPARLEEIYLPHSAELISKMVLDTLERQKLAAAKKIFLIGIRGVSMAGIAKVLRSLHKEVSGSDIKAGGHRAENISQGTDLVVYSSAAGPTSGAAQEHERAHELKIPTLKRSKMIGWLMRGTSGIAVSGMHGKTTIASLISRYFALTGADPSYLIGADPSDRYESAHLGRGEHFIAEACEYDGSFLDFPAKVAVVANIEEEHLDYFKGGLKEIKTQFGQFIRQVAPGGAVVYCADDRNSQTLIEDNKEALHDRRVSTISYGFGQDCEVRIKAYHPQDGRTKFTIVSKGEIMEFITRIPGRHFALNVAAAWAVGKYFSFPLDGLREVVHQFRGAARRFSYLGEKNGVTVYDDYAHHPTEISATLEGMKELFPLRRKIVIFEPHQQNRFNNLYNSFVRAFATSPVEVIGVLPVYRVAGRDEEAKFTSEQLVEEVAKKTRKKVQYLADYEQAGEFLRQNTHRGDVVLTMGATDVYKVAERYLWYKIK